MIQGEIKKGQTGILSISRLVIEKGVPGRRGKCKTINLERGVGWASHRRVRAKLRRPSAREEATYRCWSTTASVAAAAEGPGVGVRSTVVCW